MNEKDDITRVVTAALEAGICRIVRRVVEPIRIDVWPYYLNDYWQVLPAEGTVYGQYAINVGKKRMALILAAIEAAEAKL